MSAPRFVDCRCGHNKLSHEVGKSPACCHEDCPCLAYRPDATTTMPQQPAMSIGGLIDHGKRSKSSRTVNLAKRVECLAEELRDRLIADKQAADAKRRRDAAREAARTEIERLQHELAAARARLKSGPPPRATAEPVVQPIAAHACPVFGCDRRFASPQAVAMHRRRAHEGFDPNAAKAE